MRVPSSSYLCSDEPRLADVLEDPVIVAIMARDGVRRAEMDDLVRSVQQRLRPADKKTSICL